MNSIISKLDLGEFIDNFSQFLARSKPLFMQGDVNQHFRFIQKISKTEFTPPKDVKNLDSQLMYLKKSGTLKIYEIYEFVKIIEYFLYLKKISFEEEVLSWIEKIAIPSEILEICGYFDKKGNLRDEIDERFLSLNNGIKSNKEKIKENIRRLLSSQKISNYLVDRQIHYIDDNETLLLRGGFNHVIKGTIVARSSAGFFYISPEIISSLKRKEADLLSQKNELIYEYEKSISKVFVKFEKFLSFINKEFDRFDNYQARIMFSKSHSLEFIKPTKHDSINLVNFSHPALHNPKPISINFDKKILMITGVNAGGKTMLLKSILSAVFLSKYLLPMKINASKSQIAQFKEINAIIDDPQNVKNDISTFAGRMVEFSKLFKKDNFIAGVDEIELGTDSDEAASLFKVILESLIKKNVKIIITTHHKRLASMLATNTNVSLSAAIYDEQNQKPTFEFLHGTIGKSYAFETAQRYGIPNHIIQESKIVYGEDKENLNDLIQTNIDLELKMREKIKILDKKIEKTNKLQNQLKYQKEQADQEIQKSKYEFEKRYIEAIEAAKKAAKGENKAQIHKMLNEAHKKKQQTIPKNSKPTITQLQVGDYIKYNNTNGIIKSIKKNEALIECKGIKLRVPLKNLKRNQNQPPPKKIHTKVHVQKPTFSSIKLDLHGLRAEEAIEKLDKFLSDALITGYDEVLVYHGIGSGKLAYAVKEFLKKHPRVEKFSDAPANMGGFGATVVRL